MSNYPGWEPRPSVYWDVKVVGSSGDQDELIDQYETVLVLMFSSPMKIDLLDKDNERVARFLGFGQEGSTHAVITESGVEILNCTTADGIDVVLELRPTGT